MFLRAEFRENPRRGRGSLCPPKWSASNRGRVCPGGTVDCWERLSFQHVRRQRTVPDCPRLHSPATAGGTIDADGDATGLLSRFLSAPPPTL